MSTRSVGGRVEAWVHRASRLFASLSIVVLLVMMLFMAGDVGGRYLLNKPIPGSIDFVTVMMVILVFPAFAFVTSQDGHVRTDILYDRLSSRGKGLVDLANSLLSIFVVVLMTWRMGARAWSIIQHPPGIATSYFQWPHLPFIILATLGTGLMSVELIIWFCHSLGRAMERGGERAKVAMDQL